jgi:hypothetical protein
LGSQNRPSKAEAASARLTEERATQAAAPERRGFPLACSYRVSASAASSERFRTFVAAKPLRLTRTRSASSRASALTAFYPSSAVLFIRAGKENNVSDPRHGRVALVACAGQHEKKESDNRKAMLTVQPGRCSLTRSRRRLFPLLAQTGATKPKTRSHVSTGTST